MARGWNTCGCLATVALAALALGTAGPLLAAPLPVANPGFEDVSGQSEFNEFTFGLPAGWSFHDPAGVIASAGTYTGTLEPNGTEFFSSTAPEGVKVAILFNEEREGEGEYGYEQTLADTLQADTRYELTVEVGNIASGTAENGAFFDLDEFPGYRVELLAGGVVLAQDLDDLSIPEGEWDTSSVVFEVGGSHPQLGQSLGIRLVHLNQIPPGHTQQSSPDLEVDFDQVALDATPLPEPAATGAIGAGALWLGALGRTHRSA